MIKRGIKGIPKIFPIGGHVYRVKKFSETRHCALCDGKLWSMHGVECDNCGKVAHRGCCQTDVLNMCPKSNLQNDLKDFDKTRRLRVSLRHQFKRIHKV